MGKVVALTKKVLSLLPTHDRRKVIRTVPFLVALSLLDLIGIVLLGTVATLTFNVVSNDSKPTRLELIFQNLFGIETSRNSLILILSIIAIIFLTLKTVSQAIFGYRFAKFQARLETDLASKLYDSLLNSKVSKINQSSYSLP